MKLVEVALKKVIKIGKDLMHKVKQMFMLFLKKNIDVFAWSLGEMTRIDSEVITHSLQIDPFA